MIPSRSGTAQSLYQKSIKKASSPKTGFDKCKVQSKVSDDKGSYPHDLHIENTNIVTFLKRQFKEQKKQIY